MSGKIPKYQRIKATLLADIRAGKYGAGNQLPTREKLIRHFKVTRTTLDRALTELRREGVLSGSRRRGTMVNAGRPQLDVAVVSPLAEYRAPGPRTEPDDLQRMFGSMLLAARDQGVRLEFYDEKQVRDRPAALNRHEAIVWVQPDDATLARLPELGARVLVVNRYPDRMRFVSTNHCAAMREATTHCLRQGGRNSRVFYLDPGRESFVFRERREGFIAACEQQRRFYRICRTDWSFAETSRTLKSLAMDTRGPIVIILPTSLFTGAVLKAAAEQGLRYGRDLFCADFDNPASVNRYGFQVTTVVQDYRAMGEMVIEALTKTENTETRIFIPYKIERTD
jgi:hypothetical protein